MPHTFGFTPTKKMREAKNQLLPVVEPVVKPVVEPVVKPVVKPVVEPVVKPVVEPVVKPVPVLVKYPYPPQTEVVQVEIPTIEYGDSVEVPIPKKKKKDVEIQRQVELNPLSELESL